MTALIQLFYVSSSLAEPGQVDEILAASRTRNAHAGLTGVLLFTGGHFAQVLEGEAEAVDETMARIARDRRHANVRQLLRASITHRRFGDWSMACSELPGADDLVAHLSLQVPDPAARAERLIGLMFAQLRKSGPAAGA